MIENRSKTFVQNKGDRLEISMIDENGEIYPENIIIYVLVHEMSHILNVRYGHGPLF
jgi:hypothetical protein